MTAEQTAKDLTERHGMPSNLEELNQLLQIAYRRGECAGMTEGTIMSQSIVQHTLDTIGKVLR